MTRPTNLRPFAISRRGLLKSGVVILGVAADAALAERAAAATSGKFSQAQAGYKASAKGAARCDKCVQFQPPTACKIVDGVVSPSGSCNFFAPRPK